MMLMPGDVHHGRDTERPRLRFDSPELPPVHTAVQQAAYQALA
jgi:hypothetical protein